MTPLSDAQKSDTLSDHSDMKLSLFYHQMMGIVKHLHRKGTVPETQCLFDHHSDFGDLIRITSFW